MSPLNCCLRPSCFRARAGGGSRGRRDVCADRVRIALVASRRAKHAPVLAVTLRTLPRKLDVPLACAAKRIDLFLRCRL